MIGWNGSPASGERHRARPTARLWIGKVRRACYFSPLALGLALMLLAASFAPMAVPGFATRAEAQVVIIESCAPSKNRIIQEICEQIPPNGPTVIEVLPRWEAGIIDKFLEAHQLPPEDRPLVLKYARTDVRSGMLTKILGIIHTPADQRTADDQAVYDWFQGLVWQNEKDMIQAAIDEYNHWFATACTYTLDPEIAQAYNLSYTGAPFCHPDPFSLGPESPDKNYFLAVGLKHSYGEGVSSDPRGPAISAATARGIAFYVGLSTIGFFTAVSVAFGTSAVISSGVAALVFPFFTAIGVAAAAVGAVVFFVLLTVLVGILAGIKVFSPTALNDLQAQQATILAAPTNLTTFTDGTGVLKLNQTFVAQTLPDFPSSDAPPERQPGDGFFVIQPGSGSSHPSETLAYRDWDNVVKTVTPVGGWFVVSQTLSDGSVKREMTLSIDYKDWNSRKWTAWRTGETFVASKGETDPVFTTPDFAGPTIDLLDGAGTQVHVSFGHPPAFTSASTAAFSIGAASSFTITTTGTTPAITLATGALPSGVTFSDRHDGTATLSGTPAAGTAGSYPLTLLAKSVAGEVTQSFMLFAGTAPVFSSVPALVFREGRSVSLTIVAVGAPPPSIRLALLSCSGVPEKCTPSGDPALPSGLTFKDVGDGTATITGTPAAGTAGQLFFVQNLTATNSNGMATQPAPVTIKPPLGFTSAASATFGIGISGTFTVRTTGGPLSLSVGGELPSNVSFADNGNGTATLAGTPPAGTRGTYPLTITATADDGSVTQSFTLAVESRLTALGPAKAWIGITNSDNVGLRVDLLAEVFLKVGGTVTMVGQGQLDNQTTGSSGFNNALLKTIPVGLIGAPMSVPVGAELQYKLSVRRTCAGTGHNTGTAAFWYDGRSFDSGATRDAGSRIATTVGAVAGDFFMHPGLGLTGTAGTGKTSVTAAVTSAQPCPARSYTPFGTWSGPLP